MKFKLIGCALLSACILCGCGNESKDDAKYKIGVAQIVEHSSLNTIRDSFKKQMKVLGYDDKAEIEYKDAGNDQSTLNSIMQNFDGNKMDVIVAIATPTAQAAANYRKHMPVVFSAVSDPIGAGLIDDLNKPNLNITGTSDEIQVDQILSLALQLNENIKTVGFIYNSSEANSISNLEKAKAFCKEKNIELNVSPITSSGEVKQAADILVSKCDAIFAPNDNTIATAMPSLAKVCKDALVPLYTGADSMVQDGGFASVGIDYKRLGKETANMVDEILKGKDVKEIPVRVFKEDLNIYVNKKVMKELNIKLPESILKNKNLVMMGK
ncbi:MAG: ABC transporter substrate-binding protein [Erysipelotrichaceae bacterium]